MLEAVGEVFPEAKYQRCTVHFYRNVFSVTPRSKVKLVAKMLKAIHAQESKRAAREKDKAVVEQPVSYTHSYIKLIKNGTPLKSFPSVMLWGPPGIGKSQGVREIAGNIQAKTGKKVSITDVCSFDYLIYPYYPAYTG